MDNPVLTVTKTNPNENEEITFTCTEDTSDTGVVYKWFHKNSPIPNESGQQMKITGGRSGDGEYHCTTKTTTVQTEKESNKKTIDYLCE